MQSYEPVIGLEVHAQLLTRSKAFCGCSTMFGEEPNSNVCPVCLGLPGILPVLNARVVEFVLRMGLATGCTIAQRSVFARKNYFYPDLPKGYQISQYENPICAHGSVEIELKDGTKKSVGINRIHMEEDAGKLIHDIDRSTLVDVNRCGVPLIEIVSEPDLHSPHEAYQYLSKIRQIVTYLGICNGNMEEGSLRCDANVSVRPAGETTFGTKTELKNLNSFRFVEKALEFEIHRQIAVIESGGEIVQETLQWDASKGVAVSLRSKEEAHDYRYFPEPDLVPVVVEKEWIERVRRELPEFPSSRRDRYVRELSVPKYDADILTGEKELADYFEEVLSHLLVKNAETFKMASNWIMTEVLHVIKEEHYKVGEFPIRPPRLAELMNLIVDQTISGRIAKEIFERMLTSQDSPRTMVERDGLGQISDERSIESAVAKILRENQSQVKEYLGGKRQVYGYLVGETMKAMQGRANPKSVNDILKKQIEKQKPET